MINATRPQCCMTANSIEHGGIWWVTADPHGLGPDQDGWCINSNVSYPDPAFVRILFCPHCGAKLRPPGECHET